MSTLLSVIHKTPALKVIISMDSLSNGVDADETLMLWAADKKVALLDMQSVIKFGAKTPHAHFPPTSEDLATICYTSGTTGNPKGAMLPHRCFLAPPLSLPACGITLTSTDTIISYLPLAHCFERVFEIGVIVSKNIIPQFNHTGQSEKSCSSLFWEE